MNYSRHCVTLPVLGEDVHYIPDILGKWGECITSPACINGTVVGTYPGPYDIYADIAIVKDDSVGLDYRKRVIRFEMTGYGDNDKWGYLVGTHHRAAECKVAQAVSAV